MSKIPLFQVDAFVSDKEYSGNPAAVCILDQEADPVWMQNVAMEMNLSETAFLHRNGDGYDLRWFTPSVEVALCGHATLASAHVLWEFQFLKPGLAQFYTKSGTLTARKDGERIELDFPAKAETRAEPPALLLEGLGVSALYVGKNQFDYLVEVDSEETVRRMNPDHRALKQIPVRGVMVTSRASPPYDCISRFFAPGSGVDEDPVTGSAHCALGPYWAAKLKKDSLVAYQASPRGGVLYLRTNGDRVKLAGKARTVFRAELL